MYTVQYLQCSSPQCYVPGLKDGFRNCTVPWAVDLNLAVCKLFFGYTLIRFFVRNLCYLFYLEPIVLLSEAGVVNFVGIPVRRSVFHDIFLLFINVLDKAATPR